MGSEPKWEGDSLYTIGNALNAEKRPRSEHCYSMAIYSVLTIYWPSEENSVRQSRTKHSENQAQAKPLGPKPNICAEHERKPNSYYKATYYTPYPPI